MSEAMIMRPFSLICIMSIFLLTTGTDIPERHLVAQETQSKPKPPEDRRSLPLPLRVEGSRILNSDNMPVRAPRGQYGLRMEQQRRRASVEHGGYGDPRLARQCHSPSTGQDRWFGKTPEQKDEGNAYRSLVSQRPLVSVSEYQNRIFRAIQNLYRLCQNRSNAALTL